MASFMNTIGEFVQSFVWMIERLMGLISRQPVLAVFVYGFVVVGFVIGLFKRLKSV